MVEGSVNGSDLGCLRLFIMCLELRAPTRQIVPTAHMMMAMASRNSISPILLVIVISLHWSIKVVNKA